MPYCHKCGLQVGSSDAFCVRCGMAQPVADFPCGGSPAGMPHVLTGMSPRTASLLCYIPVIGWLAAIVILASAQFRHNTRVRFDAFQGLYLFVAWLVVQWVIHPLFSFPGGGEVVPRVMTLALFGAWILMTVKTAQHEPFKLPILGELAEKSVTEQR